MPALVRAKLSGVTWHTLRHTFASRLAMNGQAPSTIAALLRHSGTDLVARYAHLSPTHLQGALEGLAGFGKINTATNQTRDERREEAEFSVATVTGTGTLNVDKGKVDVQALESIGRGERI